MGLMFLFRQYFRRGEIKIEVFHLDKLWLIAKIVLGVIALIIVLGISVFAVITFRAKYDKFEDRECRKKKDVIVPVGEKVVKKQVQEIPVLKMSKGLYMQGLIMEFEKTKKDDSFIIRIFDKVNSTELFVKKDVIPEKILEDFLVEEFPKESILFKVVPWAKLVHGKIEINYSCVDFGRM